MSTVKNSVFCRCVLALILALRRWYGTSLLSAVLHRLGLTFRAAWGGSVLGRGLRNSASVRFLLREGALSRAWGGSLLCRGLTTLVSLPTMVLQLMYQKTRPASELSATSRYFLAAAEQTPLLVGWMMLAVMVVPYKAWNNAYALTGVILCMCLAVFAGVRKPDFRLSFAAIGPWFMAFAGMVILAWHLSPDHAESTRHLMFHLTSMLCVFVLVTTVEEREHLVRLMTMSTLAMAVMSCMGFYQRVSGVKVNPSYVDLSLDLNRGMPGRVFSFYENPNAFGEVLLLLIPLSIALVFCARTWYGKSLACLGCLMGCGALLMTYSRAGWVGLAVAVLLFLFLWNKKLVPVIIVLALAATLFLPQTISNRILSIFSSSDSSTNSRFPYYEAAWKFIQVHPVLGGGLGSDVVRKLITKAGYFTGHDRFVHCHNIYLQIWCETGAVGLVTFVAGMLWTIRQGIRSLAVGACARQTRFAVIGGVSALLGSMVCGLADYLWMYPRVMLIFWFVAGIALAGIKLAARENEATV